MLDACSPQRFPGGPRPVRPERVGCLPAPTVPTRSTSPPPRICRALSQKYAVWSESTEVASKIACFRHESIGICPVECFTLAKCLAAFSRDPLQTVYFCKNDETETSNRHKKAPLNTGEAHERQTLTGGVPRGRGARTDSNRRCSRRNRSSSQPRRAADSHHASMATLPLESTWTRPSASIWITWGYSSCSIA